MGKELAPKAHVQVKFCSDPVRSEDYFPERKPALRDDPYWTSRKNSLELIELSSINKVSLV